MSKKTIRINPWNSASSSAPDKGTGWGEKIQKGLQKLNEKYPAPDSKKKKK